MLCIATQSFGITVFCKKCNKPLHCTINSKGVYLQPERIFFPQRFCFSEREREGGRERERERERESRLETIISKFLFTVI
jgi:hypothetical protein